MKEIRTEDAAGMVLAHDVTEIVRGVRKGPAFRKGHIITEDDIPVLLRIGKDHIYIYECPEGMLHEDDAAAVLGDITQGEGLRRTEASEGKIELVAEHRGLFISDVAALNRVNSVEGISIATIFAGLPVEKDTKVAGMRVIPLVIAESVLDEARKAAGDKPLFSVRKYNALRYSVITTGTEVFRKRIEDTFTPVIEEKLSYYGSGMVSHETVDDDKAHIVEAIGRAASSDAEMIICTGGMSVDPDDRTPAAIRESGARIVSYGSPVLPGAMFLMAYLPDGRPIVGLPGCVMYAKRTVFDLVLPYIEAGIEVTKELIVSFGNGGLGPSFPDYTIGRN